MLLLPLLLACEATGPEPGVAFSLRLAPVVPSGQAPFERLDALTLLLERGDGTVEEFPLATSGSPEVRVDGVLADAVVHVVGERGGQVVSGGQSLALQDFTGTVDLTMLVAELEVPGTLEPLREGRIGAALVAVGAGRFQLLGGSRITVDGSVSGETFGDVWQLDLGLPDDPPAFTDLGRTLVGYGADNATTERMGHSATVLTQEGPDQGQVLVAGGTSAFLASDDATSSTYLYDPTTARKVALNGGAGLKEPRFDHLAVESLDGDVVVIGGWGKDTSPSLTRLDDVEVYRRDLKSFEQVGAVLGTGIGGAAAPLGTQGVMHCGGAAFTSGGELWYTVAECSLIEPDGTISALPSLPAPLIHFSMTALDGAKVLVAGGLTVDAASAVSADWQRVAVAATDQAWLYDHANRQWFTVDPLTVPRTRHSAVTLTDGRVLIAGGLTSANLFLHASDAVAVPCLELFDPIGRDFEALSTCGEGDAAGDLPTGMASMAVAQDLERGLVVFAGGMGSDTTVPDVAVFAVEP